MSERRSNLRRLSLEFQAVIKVTSKPERLRETERAKSRRTMNTVTYIVPNVTVA